MNSITFWLRFAKWIRVPAAMLFLLPALNLPAQYDNVSVVGIVHDQTGAVIAGATVNVMNKATGAQFKATSNSGGEYEAPGLRTGTYKITAERTGFSTAV